MLTVRLQRLRLRPGDWVLDLGAGEGRHVHGVHVLGGVNVVGADLDIPALQKGLRGVFEIGPSTGATGFVAANAYRTPFRDNAFDAVICSEVLEHLHDYPAALDEIVRVLKPDGAFVATVPHAWPERLCWKLAPGAGGYADQPGGHVRIFKERSLREAIVEKGFSYTGRHLAHGLHSPYWWLKCALWGQRDTHPLIVAYRRFLEWDILSRPMFTRALEAAAAPIMGKSLALYFRRSA